MNVGDHRPCRCGAMAGITLGSSADVGAWLGLCVERPVRAAVTAGTSTGRPAVVHLGRGEGREIGVAGVALGRRRYVVGRFAQGVRAVVAGRATPGHGGNCRRMVEAAGRPGRRRVVASRALRRRGNVCRRFALGVLGQVGAAVAGRTIRQTGMIHRRWRPGGEAVGVTGVALAGHRDVARRFGQRVLGNIGAGVTGRALPRCAGMAHLCRLEGNIVVVAGIAGRRGRDVAGRLAKGIGPVVAGRAGSGHHVLVRVAGRLPGRRRMAGIAPGCRLDVDQRLAQGVGKIVAATVAGGALPGRSCMTHLRWPEGREIGMTAIALRTGRNVIDRLAERRAAVVAGRTIPGRAGLVGILHQRPAVGRGVAAVTLGGGADMGKRLGQCIAVDIGAAMADRTLALQAVVIHHRRRP